MFGFFSKNKGPFKATVQPLGQSITVKGGTSENLLKVALENGIPWPHNCRVGSCGQCKCKLISGKIKPLNDFSYVLDGKELDEGYILACQTMLKSDIEVEVNIDTANAVALPKARHLAGTISHVQPLTHDIVEVGIQLDSSFDDYLPGQYGDLSIPGIVDQARSYSFSTSPKSKKANEVNFFIRRVPNGALTEWLHNGDHVGQKIELDGPHGTFYLRKSEGPILMIGGGSGLAPIRALMQQIIEEGVENDVTMIFGARTQQDLYCLDEIHDFASKTKGRFNFVPVLSMEDPANGWQGATGHCPEAISADMIDPKTSRAYMCGPPAMIDAAIANLKKLGVPEDQIFYDKFLDASSMPGGRA